MMKKLIITIIAVAVVLTAYFLLKRYAVDPPTETPPVSESQPEPEPESESEPEPEEPAEQAALKFPVGKLIITSGRGAYQDGDMVLEIPRLELTVPVINGTDNASLQKGVGLFDYAQLPGPDNSNVSIAGHRDIHGMEFYYIDRITTGDYLYLYYEDKKYTYEYAETFITNDSDWDPIRVKEDSRITLQSCDPIGTALNRIFVVGKLVDIEDA